MYNDKRIQERKKGGRYMARVIPFLSFGQGRQLWTGLSRDGRTQIGTFKLVNTFNMRDSFGDNHCAQALEITLTDGTLVPAYRLSPRHSICQHPGYIVK